MRRPIAIIVILAGVLCGVSFVGGLLLSRVDLAPTAARYLASSTGRKVAVGAMYVALGRTIKVSIHNLSVSNVEGGSAPEMVELADLAAEIAPSSLIFGAPVIEHLSIDGLRILLEHTKDGQKNWRFGAGAADTQQRSAGRSRLPAMLDTTVRNAEIDLHTSSGAFIRLHLNTTTLAAKSMTEPVTLTVDGAYNNTGVQITVLGEPITALRDDAKPYGIELHATVNTAELGLKGTVSDPLDFDYVQGNLTFSTPDLAALLANSSVPTRIPIPFAVAGQAARQGDIWTLGDASGTLRDQSLRLAAKLVEGTGREPDNLTLDGAFPLLDLQPLLTAAGVGKSPGGTTPLRLDPGLGLNLDAHLAAQQLVYGTIKSQDVDLKAKLTADSLAIDPLTLSVAGGSARMSGSVRNTDKQAVVQLDAALSGVDTAQFIRLFGATSSPLSGPLDARVVGSMTGATVEEAYKTNRAFAWISMAGGSVERRLVRLAATDIRLLFRPAPGMVRLNCLSGLAALRNGVARVAPLRMRTAEGALSGSGTVDIRRNLIDLIVGGEGPKTSSFALHVPMRITGPLADPAIRPKFGGLGPMSQTDADLREMPSALRQTIARSACGT